PAGIYVPIWLVLVIALIMVAGFLRDKHRVRVIGFLLTCLVLITIGVLLLPGGVRIHYAILVFPFPQLIIVPEFAGLWDSMVKQLARGAVRVAVVFGLTCLAATQAYAIAKTEKLMAET